MIPRSLSVAALVLLLGAGCHKATVESYRIPKEKDPEMPLAMPPGAAAGPMAGAQDSGGDAGNAMASTAVPTAEGPGLTWKAPDDWKAKPGSPMRKGSYSVPGAGGEDGDLSITAFPGDVEQGGLGGELANINRWRGQVDLPPVSDADLTKIVHTLAANGLTFHVVDFTGSGAGAHGMLGAFTPYNGATWFIKLAGPTDVVAKAKPEFMAFLQTIKPSTSATQ